MRIPGLRVVVEEDTILVAGSRCGRKLRCRRRRAEIDAQDDAAEEVHDEFLRDLRGAETSEATPGFRRLLVSL